MGRAKKLYPGDEVTFGQAINLTVETEVTKKGYVCNPKAKKIQPLPRVDSEGGLEGKAKKEETK